MVNVTLEQVNKNVLNLHKEITEIKEGIRDLKYIEIEVKPEYFKKLNEIERGKFLSREDFEKEIGE